MRILTRFYSLGLLSVVSLAPVSVLPGTALAKDNHRNDERKYQDARHHDEQVWNDHEDRAYRVWLRERHRKYNDFARLHARDQQAYWDWRHDHSDAQLKIDIR
jgi:hypothetical protein